MGPLVAGRRGVPIAIALIALAGCGGEDGGGGEAGPLAPEGGRGGALSYALAADPGSLDPLLASTRSALVVTRQVHEPLVARVKPPFERGRSRRGLALGLAASADRQVWRVRLRRGVRFQDGRPLNAAAVAVNATRWASLRQGRRLLPHLLTVDAPRTALVRFVFDRPVRDLARRLASPRLGLVSPAALKPRNGVRARLRRTLESGSGPFELRERRRGKQLTMARSESWWGRLKGLEPALDQVEFRVVPSERERADLLRRGQVLVAGELGAAAARRVRRDPLLTTIGGTLTRSIGLERSVRGLDASGGSLSGVWLTRLEG